MTKPTVTIAEDIDEGQIYIQWDDDPLSELVLRMSDLEEYQNKMVTWGNRLRELGVNVIFIKY